MKKSVAAIIPARFESTRLPGKPLIDLAGAPMIIRVIERARNVSSINRIITATDDDRIFKVVSDFGYEAIMTSPHHKSGTDRIAEAASDLDVDIVINIQGDEPLIEPSTIESALTPLLEDSSLNMSTTCEAIESVDDVLNPNIVKVIKNNDGFAINFSRSPIPYPRDAAIRHGSLEKALRVEPDLLKLFFKHNGLYVYRKDFLMTYSKTPQTPLELTESLEQMRAIEYGHKIKVVSVAHRSIGVDTPEDLEKARKLF